MIVEVGRVDDFAEGVPGHVHAGGRGLVVVRVRGRVYALRDVCPHQMTSFAGAVVESFATGAPGAPVFDAEEPIIQCPWHRYEFSLTTGRCLTGDRFRIRSYPVTVRDGAILVDLAPAAPAS